MKKQYIAAAACLMAGVIGFTGAYTLERSQRNAQEEAKQLAEITAEETKVEKVEPASKEVKPQIEQAEEEKKDEVKDEPEVEIEPKEVKETLVDNTPHFSAESKIPWPLEGDVLLPYSMDATIYFPTLDQYQYNPALVIRGDVNSEVKFVAKGKITDIYNNEETGCTVVQDIGDGYSVVYGQLKELPFKVGDSVECGQTVGYVSEPTKYYSLEGSNLYFELLKDNEPVNPMDYFQ